MALTAKKVYSFEIDKDLIERLKKVEGQHDNLTFVFQDFMKVDLKEYLTSRVKVVANIPYYITTPIIFKLLDFADKIDSMMFMVQKEVAERFCAKKDNKMYGITSVILQSIADVKYVRTIKKECFTPAPKVDSALIKLELKLDKYNINNREFFINFVHNCFAMRRKTLVNNISTKYNISKEEVGKILTLCNLNIMIRPENISIENYVNLANIFEQKLQNNKKIN